MGWWTTFNPSTLEAGDLCMFKASMVYEVSFKKSKLSFLKKKQTGKFVKWKYFK